ncbi:ABC transporter permease [Periweissella fabaria]|uniref:ABC transporter permease n=1 Tax=Periweissella fabaria TaxID=546157 RepID=A0ABN8BDI5_9LACO|nr:ABC transporter permease [Periweissella fabaria]MCM0596414.1 ABC transporter permease [Periweissella fabaria]CAH0415858.1 hypothetical protein WFA24289_00156 [Periweissella fabaria]
MSTLLRQEIFKLRHQNIAWITMLFNILVMTIFAVFAKLKPEWISAKGQIMNGFNSTMFLAFFLISVTATIFASEFQYGTIKALLYRKYYRGQVFASKVLTLLLYSILNYILIFGYTLLLKVVLFNNVNLSGKAGTTTVLGHLGLSLVGAFVGIWMILALVLLITNLFKTSAAAITIGILGYFAASLLQLAQAIAIEKWTWLKWNPLNMLNAGAQISTPDLHEMTHFSTPMIVTGSVVYTLIFLALAYVIFKKRNV